MVSVFFISAFNFAPVEVRVSEFGAMPGDGIDDSKSILTAIEHARANGIHSVRFEDCHFMTKIWKK